jgi:hypothetical protein
MGDCASLWIRSLRTGSALAVLLLLAVATQVSAAVVESREITISIESSSFLRQERMLIVLTDTADTEAWQEYPIWLDEHVELVACTAEVLDASGEVVHSVPLRNHRRIESPGYNLYASDWLSVIPFPALAVGQNLRLDYVRRWRPLYPATRVSLVLGARQRDLRVQVRGGGDRFRWHIASSNDVFALAESAGGINLQASEVAPHDLPDLAPSADMVNPVLLLAWGEPSSWSGIGQWFNQLVGEPQIAAQVADLARSLCSETAAPRTCIEAAADYVKRQVRYEAVEIGRGSWVPTDAATVLARGWGDCKDKSLLLKQMLAVLGVPAHLVLIRSGADGGIATDFAWPGAFNHLIVAIPSQAVAVTEDDPVNDGYLFIDPTSDMGGVSWLTPSCQGRPALVISDEDGTLVRTPERSRHERRHLQVVGKIEAEDTFTGEVRLLFTGARAVARLRETRIEPRDRIEERVSSFLMALVPGARIDQVEWREITSGTPSLQVSARIVVAEIGQGQPGRRSLKLSGLTTVPESRILDNRTVPVVLLVGEHSTEWKVALPDSWCPPVTREDAVENRVGSFVQTVTTSGEHTLHFNRRVILRQNLVAVDAIDDLRALAVAESRAANRRIRFRCQQPTIRNGNESLSSVRPQESMFGISDKIAGRLPATNQTEERKQAWDLLYQ